VKSGVQVSEELRKQFINAGNNTDLLYVKIAIKDETFIFVSEGKRTGNLKSDFAALQKELVLKEPCYVVMRVEGEPDKWLLVFFVPDNSQVRLKMLYASSNSSLKQGLGGAKFVADFALSDPKDCTIENYTHSTAEVHEDQVMTWQEKEAKEAAFEQHIAMSEVKVSAVVGVPIPVADEALEAIKGLKAGKHDTVIFVLNPETEVLGCSQPANLTIDQITANHFPEREPRYALHRFKHDVDGVSTVKDVFIYYCPDKAKPRLRMFYSTAKANVLKILAQLELEAPKNVECSLPNEISHESILIELYPKAEVKSTFKKPSRPGKGGAKFTGAKFGATSPSEESA